VQKEPVAIKTLDVIFQLGDEGLLSLSIDGCSGRFINSNAIIQGSEQRGGNGEIVSSMHGLLLEILVAPGDRVSRDETLAIVEAMKMQLEIKSDVNGTVSQIACTGGDQIAAGDLIMEITLDEE
jgi:biotin carboxyl carrier protein